MVQDSGHLSAIRTHIVSIHQNFPITSLHYMVAGFLLTIAMLLHVFVMSVVSYQHAGIFITHVLKYQILLILNTHFCFIFHNFKTSGRMYEI